MFHNFKVSKYFLNFHLKPYKHLYESCFSWKVCMYILFFKYHFLIFCWSEHGWCFTFWFERIASWILRNNVLCARVCVRLPAFALTLNHTLWHIITFVVQLFVQLFIVQFSIAAEIAVLPMVKLKSDFFFF